MYTKRFNPCAFLFKRERYLFLLVSSLLVFSSNSFSTNTVGKIQHFVTKPPRSRYPYQIRDKSFFISTRKNSHENYDNDYGMAENGEEDFSNLVSEDDMPPKTSEVLNQLVKLYRESDTKPSSFTISTQNDLIQSILDSVAVEHRFVSTSFSIDDEECQDQDACKIISFVLLHKIPLEIASLLWTTIEQNESDKDDVFSSTKQSLSNLSSWDSLVFNINKEKLPIRLRTKYSNLKSYGGRITLISSFIRARRMDVKDAISQARKTRAPPKIPNPKKLLDTIEVLSSTVPQSSLFLSMKERREQGQKRLRDFIQDEYKVNFFPLSDKEVWKKRKNTIAMKLTQINGRIPKQLKTISRNIFLSYAHINLVWYALILPFLLAFLVFPRPAEKIEALLLVSRIMRSRRLFVATIFSSIIGNKMLQSVQDVKSSNKNPDEKFPRGTLMVFSSIMILIDTLVCRKVAY